MNAGSDKDEAEAIVPDDWDQHAAEQLRDASQTAQFYVIEQFAGLARWVIASLLAVNGGALIASVGSDHLSLSGKLQSGGAFAIGLLLALLTGYANMRNAKKALPSLTKQNAYWGIISKGGTRSPEIESEIEAEWKKVEKSDLWADASGWLSFVALIVGLIVGGANLSDPLIDASATQRLEITVRND